ncbi:alpha/beta hydrolase [Streptomyces sp. NPDC090106]|uniref:alpha/beta hydrolase n=1 Tax=Streptomyces sp. NPDC090106 TaxID=3365946 RepID=UPI00382F0CAF
MPFPLNPEIARLVALGAGPAVPEDFAEGDVRRLRGLLDDGLAQLAALPDVPDVSETSFVIDTPDGHRLPVRWYRKDGSTPGSAVLHFHGGAMVAGSVDLYGPLVRTYVAWTGVPMLAVDYRLAPEAPAGTAAEDGFSALRWLASHAEALGVEPSRIAVMGDSAGGGVAAAVAILARDRGVPLARQVLVYPMLDDRTTGPDPHLDASPLLFPHVFNRTAWSAVLGTSGRGGEGAGPGVVPARNDDFGALAPAYIEVGELDIFRDEDVRYALRLWQAGVSTELHVVPGMPHAYDVLLLGEPRHQEGKIRVLREL